MSKRLGVFISSDQHLDKLIKLCRAAKGKDIEVTLFLTHLGTLLTQDPRFNELEDIVNIFLCKASFKNHGLEPPVKGISDQEYLTQAKNAEMIDECDRYIVF